MKVIFLDFDGVLNSERYVRNSGQFGIIIDPERMKLLKRIVDATGAKIVLSTSWREHWDKSSEGCDKIGLQINEIFGEFGLAVFDKTPEINLRRDQQIDCWLAEHPEVDNFAVLDDEFLSAPFLTGHFIKTANYREGLDEENVKDAIAVLTADSHAVSEIKDYEKLSKAFYGKIKTSFEKNVLTVEIPEFFGDDDLILSIYYADGCYHLSDNGGAIRHLKRYAKSEELNGILDKVCAGQWIDGECITGFSTQMFYFFKYLQYLIFIANADLFYDRLEENIFPAHKGFVRPDESSAETFDLNKLADDLKEELRFGSDKYGEVFLGVTMTYSLFSATVSYLIESMYDGKIRISDRLKGNVEGEIFEALYWDHEDIEPYGDFIRKVTDRFGATFENKNVYLTDECENVIPALFRFINVAVLLSEVGGKIEV